MYSVHLAEMNHSEFWVTPKVSNEEDEADKEDAGDATNAPAHACAGAAILLLLPCYCCKN